MDEWAELVGWVVGWLVVEFSSPLTTSGDRRNLNGERERERERERESYRFTESNITGQKRRGGTRDWQVSRQTITDQIFSCQYNTLAGYVL